MIHSNVKEMHQREKILNTYGFDVMDIDESGNLIYRQKKVIYFCIHSMLGRNRSLRRDQ